MEGVVLEVIDLTSEDGEGKEASGDVLGSPFLHPVMWNESEVTLGLHVLGLIIDPDPGLTRGASLEDIKRECTHFFSVGFNRPVVPQQIELLW